MRAPRGTTLLPVTPDRPEALLLGLEHEFQVLRHGEQVDFRTLVRTLDVPGRRIDPSDPNAYRCAWGGLITADGREAEVAVAPVECGPGFVSTLEDRAATAHRALARSLTRTFDLHGYSTHLSVATPPRLASRVASLHTQRFAAPFMMVLDRRDSPGLLVRTRPGRTELCGEYASGARLRAAGAFATGSVLACIRATHDRRYRRSLPPALHLRRAPSTQRTGWYVDRAAFGPDLYLAGRDARLRTGRATTTAQQQLEHAWSVARAALDGWATAADLVDADRVVRGDLPLGIEQIEPDGSHRSDDGPGAAPAFGRALPVRVRPFGRVEATVMSWDVVVFAIDGARRAYAAIPRHELATFLDHLDAGLLDRTIAAHLAAPPTGARLGAATDVEHGALYDEISPDHLAPAEPRPGAPVGRVGSALGRLQGGGGGGGSREDKERHDGHPQEGPTSPPAPAGPPRRFLRPAVAAGVVAAVLVVAAGLVLALGGGDDPTAAALPTTSVPAPGAGTAAPRATGDPIGRPTLPTAPVRPPQFRLGGGFSIYSADDAVVNGTCENGVTPGRVEVIVVPAGVLPGEQLYGSPLPAGATAVELTWVGQDRYEALFPSGLVEVDDVEFYVAGDCSGGTTRKTGPSPIVYSWGADIENAPISDDDPNVVLVGSSDPRLDECTAPGRVVEAWVRWGIVEEDRESSDPWDLGPVIAEEPMTLGADGVFRAVVSRERYFEELMIVGHYEAALRRCDWGNG